MAFQGIGVPDKIVRSATARWAARMMLGLGRYQKRAILIVYDLALLNVIVWATFSWRYGGVFVPPSWYLAVVMGIGPVLSCAAFFHLGIYRMVTRYMDARAIRAIVIGMLSSTLAWAMIAFLLQPIGFPRASLVVYPLLGIAAIWFSRQAFGWALRRAGVEVAGKGEYNRKGVVVYGAGPAGLQLAQALETSDRLLPVGFVDRNPTLWRQYVGGYRVHRPDQLRDLIERNAVAEVVVALDSDSRLERASVLQELQAFGVRVRTLPRLTDIASGRVTINDLRPVEVQDLLGRDAVPPNAALLARHVTGKSVLVTGAGGSIGSELCRQIVLQRPRRLVLLDVSENALYEIESEIRIALDRMASADHDSHADQPPAAPTELVAMLGSVADAKLVADILETNEVRTVYHAAAYKHVPIIERNVVLGVSNNTFGTRTLAQACMAAGVDRFVLISTDKAVRPSSVMGASKRLAEMVLQTLAQQAGNTTVFTMVRFGNVLDSSGSVIRRFRQQIADGGPVTVTHREMIRYFMSIPEAASLVIQAGAMATGGEVYLLDMGDPISIEHLARSMIRLSGLELKDEANPNGDVAIEYVGLRPGEKLREELLINEGATATEHPRIMTSREPSLAPEVLEAALADLQTALAGGHVARIHEILRATVEGYHSTVAVEQELLARGDSVGYGWPPAKSRALH